MTKELLDKELNEVNGGAVLAKKELANIHHEVFVVMGEQNNALNGTAKAKTLKETAEINGRVLAQRKEAVTGSAASLKADITRFRPDVIFVGNNEQ